MPNADNAGLLCAYDGYTSLLFGNAWGGCPSITCTFDGLPMEWTALLDTAAWFSIMSVAAARALHIDLEGEPDTELDTRDGRLAGVLVRHRVSLPARGGRPLEIEAQWFVSREWRRGAVIGWYGFLETITFGCEAGTADDDEPKFLYSCPPL
jgi:hypothetical protein